jgi:hypothetical protein
MAKTAHATTKPRVPRAKRLPPPPVRTTLERRPGYLRAIGTISVEIVNLEVMLAELLGVLLGVPEKIADAIYFAPQATGPRLTIVSNVVAQTLRKWPNYLAKAQDCLKRARGYQNRRNDILHEMWGLAENRKHIARHGLPVRDGAAPKIVTPEELKKLIYDIRVLAQHVIYLTDQIENDASYAPLPRKSR